MTERLIWALYGTRTGDNRQVEALSKALNWPMEEKFLEFTSLRAIPNFLLGETNRTVCISARKQICEPWPNIIIAAGRRSVPIARWVKQHWNPACKLVQLGRPRAPLHWFDLVITTSQYGLPAAANVLSLSLPLVKSFSNTEPLASDNKANISLPKPWTVLLVGGSTWPFVFDPAAAKSLAHDINLWNKNYGGSVIVATSPRTEFSAAATLAKDIDVPHIFHKWKEGNDSIYSDLLRTADRFIVTGDSVSMLADACQTGKPTAIWQMNTRHDPISRVALSISKNSGRNSVTGSIQQFMSRYGIFTPPRHVDRLLEDVISSGHAVWFNVENDIQPLSVEPFNEMQMAIDRIRELF